MSTAMVAGVVALGFIALAAREASHESRVRRLVAELKAGGPVELAPLDGMSDSRRRRALGLAIQTMYLSDRGTEAAPLVIALAALDPTEAGKAASALAEAGEVGADLLALASRILAEHPRDATLRLTVAQGTLKLHGRDAALQLLDAAPSPDGDLDLLHGRLLAQAGSRERAIELLKRAIDSFEENRRFAGKTAHLWANKASQARIALAEMASDNPRDRARNLAGSGALVSRSWQNHAIFAAGRREETAPGRFDPLAPIDINAEPPKRDDAREWCRYGLEELRVGRVDHAVRAYQRAETLDSTRFEAHLGLSAALRMQERGEVARIKRFPDPPELAEILVDWPALSPLERTALGGVAGPLAPYLAGRRFVLVPSTAVVPQEVAHRGVPLCGHLEIFDTHRFPAARRLGTYAYDSLPEAARFDVLAALEAANAQPHLLGVQSPDDPDTFFGDAYAAWLERRYFGNENPDAGRVIWDTFDRWLATAGA